MKQILILFFIFVLQAILSYSDILDENEYYKKAVELFENGISEYEKGDYDKGYEWNRKRAERR